MNGKEDRTQYTYSAKTSASTGYMNWDKWVCVHSCASAITKILDARLYTVRYFFFTTAAFPKPHLSLCGVYPIMILPRGPSLENKTSCQDPGNDKQLTLCRSAIKILNLRTKSTLLHELVDSLIVTEQPVHGPNASKVIKPSTALNPAPHHPRTAAAAAAAPSATGDTAVRGRLAVCPAGNEEQERHYHQAPHNVCPDTTAKAELRRSLPAEWIRVAFVDRQEHPSSAHALAAEPATAAGVNAFSDTPAAAAKPTAVVRARLSPPPAAAAAKPGCGESDTADHRETGANGPDDSASTGGGGAGATSAAAAVWPEAVRRTAAGHDGREVDGAALGGEHAPQEGVLLAEGRDLLLEGGGLVAGSGQAVGEGVSAVLELAQHLFALFGCAALNVWRETEERQGKRVSTVLGRAGKKYRPTERV